MEIEDIETIETHVSFYFHITSKRKLIFRKRHDLILVLHLKNATGLAIEQISFRFIGNSIQKTCKNGTSSLNFCKYNKFKRALVLYVTHQYHTSLSLRVCSFFVVLHNTASFIQFQSFAA